MPRGLVFDYPLENGFTLLRHAPVSVARVWVLSIESRTLDDTTLDFDQLSTGAQEQLGLLARLACATLVAPDGGAPVIFDDALGWTDPGRLDRMGAAISTAADDCQVIILTCTPGRYSAVGKARTVAIY